MTTPDTRLVTLEEMIALRLRWRAEGRVLVFTNGCFDLLHAGHATYLEETRRLGDVLVVALNTDASVRRLKGPGRPVHNQFERAEVLTALEAVDYVFFFGEDTPIEAIRAVQPDILAKGADYAMEEIVGRAEVEAAGGRCVRIPLVEDYSSTALMAALRARRGSRHPEEDGPSGGPRET
jgi:rfaE bifunctional protein nucleotidyltransferase chain/domain